MENSTRANRATFPRIIPGIHNLPTEFQETEGTVSQEHWNKIRQGTLECFLPYAACTHGIETFLYRSPIFFFFLLAMLLRYQHVTANILLWRYKKKNLGRVDKDDIKKILKIYCFIWNTGASERNVLHDVTHSLLEMDLRVKWIVSKAKPAYLNAYIINSTTLNKYIQILRRHDVSCESHLM